MDNLLILGCLHYTIVIKLCVIAACIIHHTLHYHIIDDLLLLLMLLLLLLFICFLSILDIILTQNKMPAIVYVCI